MAIELHLRDPMLRRMLRRFARPAVLLLIVLVVGTSGFYKIGEGKASIVDCLYFTFITITTIGFTEVIDLAGKPEGRIFTMVIATAGIAVFTYMLSVMTAYIVEGDLNQAFRRRRMQKRIDGMSGHYVLCGIGRVGTNVAHELASTGRPFVVIDNNNETLEAFRERYPEVEWIHADASDDEAMQRAGVARAAGVFAVTGDDAKNLVITLTAKQINPAARVVARCHEISYTPKMQRVGADAIVSPDFTGGMRIVSSMVRPHVVTFLDEMLRSETHLRVEEVTAAASFVTAPIGNVIENAQDLLLLAVREGAAWVFNPKADTPLRAGQTVVMMATPSARQRVERAVGVRTE
jgi:voltage-gated potassium channel